MATYKVKAEGKEYKVDVAEKASGGATVKVDGHTFEVEMAQAPVAAPVAGAPVAARPTPAAAKPATPSGGGGAGAVMAPIPGVVTQVCVAVGDAVTAGQTVLKLEAMKMENDIAAPIDGTITEIAVKEGSEVSDGQLMVVIG
ncbi:MAG: biotin carboxyl carrier protein [Hyphomicrobiaceae bacterium]|jgi:biotin carboxyl carrier protein